MTATRLVVGLVAALVLGGCAGTRIASFGPLPDGRSLVTLVVSEDQAVVASHCHGVKRLGTVMGCQLSWPVLLEDGRPVRSVKMVRYAETLPSPLSFEIDVHELCHTVASLQAVEDPCHVGNGGLAQTPPAGSAAVHPPTRR